MHNEMDDTTLTVSGAIAEEDSTSDFDTALSLANKKNRKFLMQLKELTHSNRTITDENRVLKEENTRLKFELASNHTSVESEVNLSGADKTTVASLETRTKELQEQIQEAQLRISELMVACEEKDRRLDLLAHLKHRRQKNDGWWKDGSDECRSCDSASVDSEISVSTLHTLSSDEPVFEYRFSRDDVHGMYQRLLSEHVTLERVHSETQFQILQLKSNIRNYQSKIESMTISLHEQRGKLRNAEMNQERLQHRYDEVQLENEQLEFQILEAQVQNEEEQGLTISNERSEGNSEKPTTGDNFIGSDVPVITNSEMKTNERNHHISHETQMNSESDCPDRKTNSLTKGFRLQEKKNQALVSCYDENSRFVVNNSSSGRPLLPVEKCNGEHLDKISADGKSTEDRICSDQFPSEALTMLTLSSAFQSPSLNEYNYGSGSKIGDFELPEKKVSSDELPWREFEEPDTSKRVTETKSSEYWKNLEEQMGLDVTDIALVIEFDDSFPADDEDDIKSHHLLPEDSNQLIHLENENEAQAPPLPVSLPPPKVKRDTSPDEFFLVQNLDNNNDLDENVSLDHRLSDVFPESGSAKSGTDARSQYALETTGHNSNDLEVQPRNQQITSVDHSSNSFRANRTTHVDDHEMSKLKKQILELEKQLTSSQTECLALTQSKEVLKRDFSQLQKIVRDKENDLKTLQEEWAKLKDRRNSDVPTEDRQTQTSFPRSENLKDSITQTTDGGNILKAEQLLQAKDRELSAKTNEVDHLSQEMREWQIKAAVESERNSKLIKQIESLQKELKAVSEKEITAKKAAVEAAALIRRLELERAELRESVTSLEIRVAEVDSLTEERDSLKQKLVELELNLEVKNNSESSLLQEVISLKKRADDLQLSLREFQGKEYDFEALQKKYEDLGNLTRRLQTAVAPMKARIARLALKCKTKDDLMRKLLNKLHRHDDAPSSLEAEVEHQLTLASTEDYTRPLSPLTISHLDQLNHNILKLDLTQSQQNIMESDRSEFYSIFPESPGNSDAYLSMLNKSLQDIHRASIHSDVQITRNIYDQPENNVSVLINSNDTSVVNENPKSLSEVNSVIQDVSNSVQNEKSDTENIISNMLHSVNSSSSGVKISDRVLNGHLSMENDHNSSVEEDGTLTRANTVDIRTDNLGIPECPSNFHVERVVGGGDVLLSWIPPSVDEISRGRGSAIAGFKVLINGKESVFLSGPHLTKVLLKSLDFSRIPLRFSLQTVSENGKMSSPVETYLDLALLRKFQANNVIESDTNDDFAESSVMSSPSRQEIVVHRKMFLAIYDYRPSGQNGKPVQEELGFQTGDIIVTYGPMRPDGYYVGKVRGRRGLVPGSFLEELAPFTSKDVADRSANRRSRNASSSSNIAHLIGRRSRSLGARLNITAFKPL